MEKDPRRFFTVSQKQEILAAFSGLCQGRNCTDRDLSNKPAEFHHVIAHSQLGATERINCIPLCQKCHREYTNARMVDQVGNPWMKLRQWQRDAVERYTENNDKVFVLEAAPGAGKSLFAATVANYEISNGTVGIDHVICIAPWVSILKSIKKSFGVYRLDNRDKFNYDPSKGVFQRRPYVPVTIDTYAGFCKPICVEILERWTNDVLNPFRFMLVLDEIHHTSTASGAWGSYLERISELASKVVVMSGTYFRGDSQPISFLEYQGDRPKTHFSISYSECVKERYTRQVSFRYHDPVLEIYNLKKTKVFKRHLSKIPVSSQKMLTASKKEVLDPNGDHVEEMIKDAWSELQAMRRKWHDAACLVVCRSGKGECEERAIHAVSQKIKKLTACKVETVTSDDAASRGKVDAFCDSDDPFICAIRMVSEGVDLPRVRMVLFLSYTDSEMLFRQIVGRCTRYIDGKEDDTAALVIMPKFPVMAAFADRFEGEAKSGALKLEPPEGCGGGSGRGAGVCNVCNTDPCKCFVVLSSETEAGGGRIASSNVDEKYIQIAKRIRDSVVAHQHSNPVQMADVLQRGSKLQTEPLFLSVYDERQSSWRKVERQVKSLARHLYRGDYQSAWVHEVHVVTGCDANDIRSTWTTLQIENLSEQLKNRLIEALENVQS